MLHAKGKCCARRHGDTEIEQEAMHFALGFLMPTTQLKPAYTRFNEDIFELSLHFLVPVEVMKLRIALHTQQ